MVCCSATNESALTMSSCQKKKKKKKKKKKNLVREPTLFPSAATRTALAAVAAAESACDMLEQDLQAKLTTIGFAGAGGTAGARRLYSPVPDAGVIDAVWRVGFAWDAALAARLASLARQAGDEEAERERISRRASLNVGVQAPTAQAAQSSPQQSQSPLSMPSSPGARFTFSSLVRPPA
jgi:hypothetical protein